MCLISFSSLQFALFKALLLGPGVLHDCNDVDGGVRADPTKHLHNLNKQK
jgi:hypothetical protein